MRERLNIAATYGPRIEEGDLYSVYGRVTSVVGLVIEAALPHAAIGGVCDVVSPRGDQSIKAEVVGFRNDRVLLMPLDELKGVGMGYRVVVRAPKATIGVGPRLLGRVMDAMGQPLDGRGPIEVERSWPMYREVINPLERARIKTPLDLGIRAINGLLTVGAGQRMAIMAGSGVGKSILLGLMAKHTAADVSVIALVGERGREVREFLERDLGSEGLKRSVVVVATSNMPALMRMRAAFVAMAIAEYFRDQGRHVLLMMDSLTRFASAQREIGLTVGEPPTSKGYTPSVFSLLPKLLERCGTTGHQGSITGLFTILAESDDMNDPLADAVRAIADGHIVLSRELAIRNHYPAIDVLSSISRLMTDLVTKEHQQAAATFREALSSYREARDLIHIGAYVKGSNEKIDFAIEHIDAMNRYLQQGMDERVNLKEAVVQLGDIFKAPKTTDKKA